MRKVFLCIMLILLIQMSAEAETIAGSKYFINTDGDLCGIEVTTENEFKAIHSILNDIVFVDKDGYAIDDNGTLWSWTEISQQPVHIMDNVVSVSSGYNHTLIVKKDNTLWGYGANDDCQLGENTADKIDTPIKIMNNVKKAVAGDCHSVILKTDGSVLTLGSNAYGQLGCGDDIKTSDRALKVMTNAKDIFAGETASFAIDDNNVLWRWGTNYGNGVGLKKDEIQFIPIKYIRDAKSVDSHWGFNLVLKEDNTLWLYGENEGTNIGYTCYPTGINLVDLPMELMNGVNSISGWNSLNSHESLILKNDGELFKFDLIEGNIKHTPEYKIEKLVDNVKISSKPEELALHKFNDIFSKPEEMQNAINALSKSGIIYGTSDTEFSPDKPITRAEIIGLLLRMTAKSEESGNGGFVDVTADKWYYHIAGASKKYEIVSGFEDNTFRGDEVTSKVQLVSLVARVLRNEKDIDIKEDVHDILDIPDWAEKDVAIAQQEELIYSQEELTNPNDPITRGEAAIILYRLYNII